MRDSDAFEAPKHPSAPEGTRPSHGRGGSHRMRKRDRGYVLPLDYDYPGYAHAGRGRKRHRTQIGSMTAFVGLSTLWALLVSGFVVLEALSGEAWFFVASDFTANSSPDTLVSEVVPGPLQDLLATDASGGDAPVLVSSDERGTTTMRWGRLFAVLTSVPLAYIIWQVTRRLRRRADA